ncbi:alpha/beta hydrolase [Candidatus Protochlamydia phocaeensis]|uniref:alpha/beta hydrolase n=1 Tax=Candidatus Protochlamydia phocaeensis TaxID=1414722 RepID=UPI0008398795|nr:alpha/beta hydrolase [Candidatus Protochlamydia phocaeensis]
MIVNHCLNYFSELMGTFIVPNQSRILKPQVVEEHDTQAERMREKYKGRVLDIFNKDGNKLHAFYFSGMDHQTNQSVSSAEETIVIFAGMGAYHYWFSAFVEKYVERGINVVIFNYRGVGKSNGKATGSGITNDGESVVDYIEEKFQVPRHLIALHAHSLGVGPASEVAKRRSGVAIISDRSYSRLSLAFNAIVEQYVPNAFLRFLVQKLKIIRGIAWLALKSTGWDFSPKSAWPHIRGRKCVITHLKDPIINSPARLFQSIYGRDADTHFITAEDDCEDPHSRLLTDLEFNDAIRAIGFRNRLN